MSTFKLYVPEDLMEAEPETEIARSDLDADACLQQPERKSPTPKKRKTWRFWKRWTSKVDVLIEEKEEEKGGAASSPEVKSRENDIRPTKEEENKQAKEHLQELKQKGQHSWTEEEGELNDVADLAEEIMEELKEPVKDKSIRRRFLNWLNGVVQDHYEKKVARTYRRELEEGNRIYRTSYMVPVWSRAQRERRKRKKLIRRDEQRQKVKERLDDYWEKKRHLKEELRLKEEERYEKWIAAHGLSVPESSPEEPKRRMSKWEKRFLRAKEFFIRQSSFNKVDEDAE